MRLLWITNYLFPEIAVDLGLKATFASGWTYSAADYLVNNYGVNFAVASTGPVDKLTKRIINGKTYYVIPHMNIHRKYYIDKMVSYYTEINNDFKPNAVHVYGTEFPHSLAYTISNNKNVVASLQALIGPYAQYHNSGLSIKEILINTTLRDIVRGTLFAQKKAYYKRGEWEKLCIKNLKYVEGRTNWDRAITHAINPNLEYFTCYRMLRDIFYNSPKWSYDKCNKHTIFLSQAHYPIKGAHIVIKALPYVLREFPDAKIVISGVDNTKQRTLKDLTRFGAYAKYLKSLIKSLGLEDKIRFTGALNAEQICNQYLNSNVFICSSAIENAPNSIAEAQILGVPVIASYVGGNSDMVEHGVNGYLYRFEEIEMLADLICTVFKSKDCSELSSTEIAVATKRHDKDVIGKTLMDIYNKISIDL